MSAPEIAKLDAIDQPAVKIARVYLRVSTDEQDLARQEQIAAAAKAFAVYYAKREENEEGGYLMDHSRAAYLMGRKGEPIALLHRQRLRVADARDPVAAGLHDHGRGDDGATGRCDTDLIDPDDAGQTLVPETAFVCASDDHACLPTPEART